MSTHPPIDPKVARALLASGELTAPPLTVATIPQYRSRQQLPDVDRRLSEASISRQEVSLASYDGQHIELSVMWRDGSAGHRPIIYFVHGGGMITGHRWGWLDQFIAWVDRYNAVVATVAYRLAPEHPDPAPVEDVYAGLSFFANDAPTWGGDPRRLVIVGVSAGGGLAAGATLLARDRSGPGALAQLLAYPMLDDRDQTVSTLQMDGVGRWDRTKNRVGWEALLGTRRASENVSPYAAPARAQSHVNLPTTYIECGSAEVFRDEDVAFASAIWAAGGEAELHVWPGGVHAFESLAPHAEISQQALSTRQAWLDRMLGRDG